MFCQINLLTLLGWLDQIGYEGKVELCLVNHKFEPLATYPIEVNRYHSLYKQVLLDKVNPSQVILSSLRIGIELYMDYCESDNELVSFIKEQPETPEERLVEIMIAAFREYGLGDVQYAQLIRSVRKADG